MPGARRGRPINGIDVCRCRCNAPATTMTIRARARIPMAPSPILVGRRFCPRFSEARAIFLVRRDVRRPYGQCAIRVFSSFSDSTESVWLKLQWSR